MPTKWKTLREQLKREHCGLGRYKSREGAYLPQQHTLQCPLLSLTYFLCLLSTQLIKPETRFFLGGENRGINLFFPFLEKAFMMTMTKALT